MPTTKVRHLLTAGNMKVGPAVFQWSIPAGDTCPGQSPACARECYAKRGNYAFPYIRRFHFANLALAERDDFARLMIADIGRLWPRVVRIHVAGDFYSPEYVRKWVQVCKVCPDVRFYAYTRSWRVPEIARELRELADLPNVQLLVLGRSGYRPAGAIAAARPRGVDADGPGRPV
jgi:hypothetical protein